MKNPVRLVNRVNFEKELQEKKLECEDMIRKYLPKEEGFAAQLAEAMNYSMEAGGKRLRPILMERHIGCLEEHRLSLSHFRRRWR